MVVVRMIVLSDQKPGTSPLARLVMVCAGLAIAASIVAGFWYLAVELPAQKNAEPPKNIKECNGRAYTNCLNECDGKHPAWDSWGRDLCHTWCLNNVCKDADYDEGDSGI
jgi:hypothetical protein